MKDQDAIICAWCANESEDIGLEVDGMPFCSEACKEAFERREAELVKLGELDEEE